MVGASSLMFVVATLWGTTAAQSVALKKYMKAVPSFDPSISEKSLGNVTYANVNYRFACPQRCNMEQCCCLACVKDAVCHMYNTVIPSDWSGVSDPSALSFDSCYSAPGGGDPYGRNCLEVQRSGNTASGMHTIYLHDCCSTPPPNSSARLVYCDMDTDGGGWTVIQRRRDVLPREDFYRTWEEYAQGFGDRANGEFWLGLDTIHALTAQNNYELRVDLSNFQGESRWAKYSLFYVHPRENYFMLDVSGYTGDAGDAMATHNGRQFTTKDFDVDSSSSNCAVSFSGAWWYNSCFSANLNAIYVASHTSDSSAVTWMPWQSYYALKNVTMMIRPTN